MAKAVDGVSLHVSQNETLCLVGESGSGKSMTAMSIMRLLPDPPGRIVAGECIFGGVDLFQLSQAEMQKVRGNRIAMIFQEPMTSLSPVYTIGDQIAEAYKLHRNASRREAWNRAVEMLARVQIPEPEVCAIRYPHQLSGGMRQRAMIAIAMACKPQLLIADEPTTALDVTIQAQILDLMRYLKKEYGTAIILITHDMGVVARMAQRVAVMYAGKIVEEGDAKALFASPRHPYTRGLLASMPHLGSRKAQRSRLNEIAGTVPSAIDMPVGCAFYSRCPQAMEVCATNQPPGFVTETSNVACWLYSS